MILGVTLKQKYTLLRVDDLIVKTSYDLSCLGIYKAWNEGKIKTHIKENTSFFIKVVSQLWRMVA